MPFGCRTVPGRDLPRRCLDVIFPDSILHHVLINSDYFHAAKPVYVVNQFQRYAFGALVQPKGHGLDSPIRYSRTARGTFLWPSFRGRDVMYTPASFMCAMTFSRFVRT